MGRFGANGGGDAPAFPSAPAVAFDLRSANEGPVGSAAAPPGGRFRRWRGALGFGAGALAAVALAWREWGVPILRWPWYSGLDAVVIPLALAAGLYSIRAAPARRRAARLEVSPEGIQVQFSDGAVERIRWEDPELDVGIGEGAGLARAPDRVLIGLWGRGWRTPALITSDARDRLLAEASRRGILLETVREDSGSTVRTTVYLHPPTPAVPTD